MASGGYPVVEAAQSGREGVPLHLHVKFLDGICFVLVVGPTDTIEIVKDKIHELHGILPEHQALLLGRNRLADSGLTLADLQVPDNAKLTLLKLAPMLDEDSAAPCLREYWQSVLMSVKTVIKANLIQDSDSSDIEQQGEDHWTSSRDEQRALVRKSFQRHDTNGDGVLDKGEAAVFFLHLADELLYTTKTLLPAISLLHDGLPRVALELQLSLFEIEAGPELTPDDIREKANPAFEEMRKKLPELTDENMLLLKFKFFESMLDKVMAKCKRFRTLSEEDREKKRSKLEGKLQKLNANESSMAKDMDGRYQKFIAEKEKRNTAAFRLLDVNSDGTVAISDVLDSLVNDREKLGQFYDTLGLSDFLKRLF